MTNLSYEIGTHIDAYRLDALIGRGGMGLVYKAWHTGLHCFHALKLLPPELIHDKGLVQRFLSEARNMARLQHPNIATIHSVSDADAPHPYFTMELVEGIDLADLLQERGSIPFPEAWPILRQIAEALDYAHRQGLIHRDIKPGNILLRRVNSGQEFVVKVVDFGIAKAQDADNSGHTKTGMIIGTPEFMSPEQITGQPVGPFSDQYALGIIAYEMLCGRLPFKMEQGISPISVMMKHVQEPPPAPATLNSALPATANAAIMKALAKEPQQRFDSCQSFVHALGGGTGDIILAPPPPSNYRPLLMGAGVLLLLGMTLVAYPFFQAATTQQATTPSGPTVDTTLPPETLPELVSVPDLVGKNKQQALAIIAAKSLKASVSNAHSNVFAQQAVASQSPKTGSQVPVGSTLKINVSLGPEILPPTPQDFDTVKQRYRDWLVAWQNMDYERYESFYSRSLVQMRANKEPRRFDTLRKRMTEHWARQSYISISSNEPKQSHRPQHGYMWIILTAKQHYDSSTWWDQGTKIVAWRKEQGEWKIVRENFLREAGGGK